MPLWTPPPPVLGSARCQHDTGCANLKTSTWAVPRGHSSTHGQLCQQCILFNWSPKSLMYSCKAYCGRRGSNNRLQTLQRVLEDEIGWTYSMRRTNQKCRRRVGRKTWEVNSKCSYTRYEVRIGLHLALMETVLHIKWQGSCLMKDLLHGVGERVRKRACPRRRRCRRHHHLHVLWLSLSNSVFKPSTQTFTTCLTVHAQYTECQPSGTLHRAP